MTPLEKKAYKVVSIALNSFDWVAVNESLDTEDTLYDLGLGESDLLDMYLALTDITDGIEISPSEIESWETVGDIIDSIIDCSN